MSRYISDSGERPLKHGVAAICVLAVFFGCLIGRPVVRVLRESPPQQSVSYQYYQSVMDSSWALLEAAQSQGRSYRAADYARDLLGLRARELVVRRWLAGMPRSQFDGIMRSLHELAAKS